MKPRKHRETSKAAHDSIKGDKQRVYDIISEGLRKLRVGGNFEEIAAACGLKPEQVWKRLPEMVEMGTCFNTGTTHPTSTGRKAMVRQLSSIQNSIDFVEGKEVSEYQSNKFITPKHYVQPDLFQKP